MRDNPKPQEIYRHFKGKPYQVVTLAESTETGETLVIYQAMYGEFKVYARELSEFLSEIDRKKYPSAGQRFRFEKAGEQEEDSQTHMAAQGSEAEPAGGSSAHADGTAAENRESNRNTADTGNMQAADSIKASETVSVPESESETINIDPLVLEFLDADSFEERLNILASLHNRITDEMINTMAVAVDVEVNEGDIEERYNALRTCLLTFEKYECNRLR